MKPADPYVGQRMPHTQSVHKSPLCFLLEESWRRCGVFFLQVYALEHRSAEMYIRPRQSLRKEKRSLPPPQSKQCMCLCSAEHQQHRVRRYPPAGVPPSDSGDMRTRERLTPLPPGLQYSMSAESEAFVECGL